MSRENLKSQKIWALWKRDSIIESELIFMLDHCQLLSTPLFSLLPHIQERLSESQVVPPFILMEGLNYARPNLIPFMGSLTLAPPLNCYKPQSHLSIPALSSRFWNCLRPCPTLPRKLYYVNNQPFYSLFECVILSLSTPDLNFRQGISSLSVTQP